MDESARTGANARNALFFLVAALSILLDRVTKIAAVGALAIPGTKLPLIEGILQLNLVYNRGAAWGIFDNSTFALGIFSIAVCLIILAFFLKSGAITTYSQAFALALVFGGGLGNAIDRFVYGRVTDFIEAIFIDFPVFNVADICVTCGVFLFIILMVVELFKETTSQQPESNGDDDGDT